MKIGTALVGKDCNSFFEIAHQPIAPCDMTVTAENMMLLPCLKCIKCGCSVTLNHFDEKGIPFDIELSARVFKKALK
jgi:hypothetical protein